MPKLKELRTNFTSGEMDPLLHQRSDVKAYFNAAEYLRNVIVIPQGGARVRPGSRYVWTVPNLSGGGVSDVRMFEFQFSTDQTYLFVFHHLKLTIFRDGLPVATVTTPYASADLRAKLTNGGDLISTGISVTQSRDTMIVFHQDYAPRQIKRNGSHTAWTVGTYTLKNVPIFDFGDVTYTNGSNEVQTLEFPQPSGGGDWYDTDIFKLILEDEKTGNIKYSPTASTLASRIQSALRKLPNVQASGVTVTTAGTTTEGAVFTLTFSGDNGQRPWGALAYETVSVREVPTITIIVTTEGERPGESVWSLARGYPRCGVFFGGRLWVAGTKFLPNTLWASRAGAQDDFNSKKIDADYGIQATTDTDDVPAFINIFAGRHLQLFSTAAEFYIPISESEPVTPENIVLRRTTSRGSKPGLRVFEVDGGTHFIQRRGKALREMIFADVELAYQSNNVSLLASHLMRDPVGFALRRSSSTDDADYEFMPNSDGTMTVFCTLRTQEVNAMTLWETEGRYDDAAAVLDEVYFSTVRSVGGADVRMIEVMDSSITMDCAVVGRDLPSPVSSVTLAHLPATMVEHEIDGFVRNEKATSGAGLLNFDRPASEFYVAGLRFREVMPDLFPGYIWLVQTLPFETQLQDGAAMGRKRRVVSVDVNMHATKSIFVNGSELPFREFGTDVLDTAIAEYTGIKRVRGFLGWDFDGKVNLGSTVSTKATVLGLSYSVSI